MNKNLFFVGLIGLFMGAVFFWTQPVSKQRGSSLFEKYDVLFVDLWGVTHDGNKAFPGSLEVFKRFKNQGKRIYFLSNSPRMPDSAVSHLQKLGIDTNHYHGLMSSGFETYMHLKDKPDNFYQKLGMKVYHVGKKEYQELFSGLGYSIVSDVKDADFLLITGQDPTKKTLDDYTPLLKEAYQYDLPVICANPDLQAFHGEELVFCSGRIAQEYENMGGYVRYHGKPGATIFDMLYKKVCDDTGKNIPKSKILMIGDALHTDIRGANQYGIDSMLVLTGIHKGENANSLKKIFEENHIFPTYVRDRLCWE